MGAFRMPLRLRIGPRLSSVLCAGLVCLCSADAIAQQSNVDFTVSGTSTVRGWTCSVSGRAAVTPGTGKPAPGFANGVQTVTMTVPVKAFKCPNDEMTQHLFDAMKPDKFPEIVYKLEKYEMAGRLAQTSGTLTILGNTQPVTLPIALTDTPQGVQIEGNTRLDMTKFGVEPPVVMLGLLKVGPQIRIEFKGLMAR